MGASERSGPDGNGTAPDQTNQGDDTPGAVAGAVGAVGADPDAILADLIPPGTVVEVRIPDAGRFRTVSGYFDDLDQLQSAVANYDGRVPGIYFTMNPVNPALLARAVNRLKQYAKLTTSDPDIERRRWVMIDLDPERPAGIGSTDDEHAAALAMADKISAYLDEQGWPAPARMDSGNGAYLLYPIDLPNDDPSRELIKRLLERLAERFNDGAVKVDTSVHNAARIVRVPGTVNAKGDGTDDRPHRRARLFQVPDHGQVVELEQLQAVAEVKPEATGSDRLKAAAKGGDFDLAAWVGEHLEIDKEPRTWNRDGFKWELPVCPFNPDHSRGEAFIGRRSEGGAIVAGCRHESCTWDWAELRAEFEGEEPPKEPPKDQPKDKSKEKSKGSLWGKGGALNAMVAATVLFDYCPVALGRNNRVAIYDHGFYQLNPLAFQSVVAVLLEDGYRPSHKNTIEEVCAGILYRKGRIVPDWMPDPLVNVKNGLVDLRTGELLEHDPSRLSAYQFPIVYDPDATCPTFDKWALETVGKEQLPALLTGSAMMLDPTQTPGKALLLYGPARSGKGTYLRMLEGVAGRENTSAVSLHELAEDHFAAAKVYGKVLNTSGDLSAGHIEDLSTFKKLTGWDLIRANPKYGKDFEFKNTALFAFSANEIPSVGETSRAYFERMVPISFANSYAGKEDPAVLAGLLVELPGFFNLLVRAWQRWDAKPVPVQALPKPGSTEDLLILPS